MLQLVDKITEAIDNNQFAAGIFIDLSKAFDTLDHRILLNKLEFYGIRGVTLHWFKSYLENRKQYVDYKGAKSSYLGVSCGVLQGSILGPILFLLYINDICHTSKILHFIIFADDTNAFVANKDISALNQIINTELANLSTWFTSNKLSVNINKSCYILFKTKNKKIDNSSLNILLNGTLLPQVKFTKFLGVLIDENLTWSNHIESIVNKISKSAGLICKLKYILPTYVLLTLYNTLILPYLNYCALIWAVNNSYKLNSILLVQKRVIRAICRTDRSAHSAPLFKRCGLLVIHDIYKLQVAQFMFRFHYHLLPKIFSDFFVMNDVVHPYFTRQSKKLHIHSATKKLRQDNIRFAGPKLWNSLPSEDTSVSSLTAFTHRFKFKLQEKYL